MKKILARLLFCEESSVDNVLLHIPVGVVNVAVYLIFPLLALLFGYGYIKYETTQRRVVQDKAYPELQGWLWGMGLTAIVILIWELVA